jgi:sterol desaturase/sphingolipid hydroxylase (fatty acid hydroxylase superfamily)
VGKGYTLPAVELLHRLGASMRSGLVLFGSLFLVIVFFEALSRASLKRYVSRNFLNDLLYSLFYRGGAYTLFVYQPFFNSLRPKLAIIDLHLLSRIPYYWSLPIYFLGIDLVGYWIHRLQHTRFFWPFHSVHHSQQTLTFLTFYRFHFVEEFFANAAAIIPLLLLGAPPRVWLPISFLQWFLQAIQHSELNWRMGPLYRAIAGPVFHSIHHSPDPQYFNKNFGMAFSFWDFLFGTAVDAPERCRIYGVSGLNMPETILGQFLTPFRMLYRQNIAAPKIQQRASAPSLDKLASG